ncbi:hypothetical protein RQP46_009616 [Phenoliferia psychrophenolica]
MIRIHSAAVSLICQLLALVCFALSFVVKNQRIKDLMQAILWLSIWRNQLSDELESLVRRLQSEKITVEEYERQKAASLGDFKSLYGTWGGEDVLAAEEARLKASLKADV